MSARTVCAILFLQIPSLAFAETLVGSVVRVTDGDTITVLDNAKVQHRNRLAGIDALERKQPYGKPSQKGLADLVAGRIVMAQYTKRDRYRRIIAPSFQKAVAINLEQVRAGYAWHYKKYQGEQSVEDRNWYAEAETDAREASVGLWQEPTPS